MEGSGMLNQWVSFFPDTMQGIESQLFGFAMLASSLVFVLLGLLRRPQ